MFAVPLYGSGKNLGKPAIKLGSAGKKERTPRIQSPRVHKKAVCNKYAGYAAAQILTPKNNR
jgi:hypothetical protein